jgi:hypothetical protein
LPISAGRPRVSRFPKREILGDPRYVAAAIGVALT